VTPHRADGEPSHDADVDPAIVVAVDHHDMWIRYGGHIRQHLVIEPKDRDAICRLRWLPRRLH
jgi:hypothetical protein